MARKPQQDRSIATVEAIIQAGIIVLAKEGGKGFSTRKIADTAGVSVGSIYEYFEDKNEIHAAIIDRLTKQLAGAIRPHIAEIVQLSLRDAIHKILTLVREMLEQDDNRILNCVRHSMSYLRNYPFKPLQKVLGELSIQYLMHHPEMASIKNLPTVSYIVIYGGMYTVIHHMADKHPPMAFEELATELAGMVSIYVDSKMNTEVSP